jgi:uncharacterized coiled-coil protein SlyX
MTTMENMQAFNELLKDNKFVEACNFLAKTSDDSILSFPRQTKVRAIEVLRKPSPEYLKTALTDTKWLMAKIEDIDKHLIQTLSKYRSEEKEEVKAAPAKRGRKPKAKAKKKKEKKKKGGMRVPLYDDDDDAITAEAAAAAAAMAGAAEVEVNDVKVEEPPSPVEVRIDHAPVLKTTQAPSTDERLEELESIIGKQNEMIGEMDATLKEAVTALFVKQDKIAVDVSDTLDRVENATKSIKDKQDENWLAYCTLASWLADRDLNEILEGFSVVGGVIKEKIEEKNS